MYNTSAQGPRPRGSVFPERSAWAMAVIAALVALAAGRFTSRDADSAIYAEISGRLSLLPVRSWLAPEWGGLWDKTGLFREHPAGIFALPALLARAGYPSLQAAFAIGVLFSVGALWLVRQAALPLVSRHEAIALQWTALVLPIAFAYRIRATQEYPVLVCTLFAIHATERSRKAPIWIAGIVGAACALALVKGVFVVFLPVVCALWLLCIRAPDAGWRRDRAPWMGIALAMLAVAVLGVAYEWAYRRLTGDSFMAFYLHDRIAANAGIADEGAFSIAQSISNSVWYVRRVLWFALPGTLALVLAAGGVRRAAATNVRSLAFALLASASYVAAMSMGANRADRYIFPAYFFTAAAGAVVAMRRWRHVHRLAERLAALPPYALPVAWLCLFLLTLVTEHRVPHLQF